MMSILDKECYMFLRHALEIALRVTNIPTTKKVYAQFLNPNSSVGN